MRSKKVFFSLFILGFLILSITGILITKSILKKDDKKNLINITSLSEEFMDNYFERVSDIKEDEKENILIVTSKEKLSNLYGAVKVIEAPNNQYFVQYETKEAKEEALEKFNQNDKLDVSENIIHEISENTVLVADYNSWGVEAMGLDTLKEKMKNHTLNNVVVAIIDTGLDVELFNDKYQNRLAGYYNVLDSDAEMTDEEGHGTHIAGTIAESTPNNVKIFPVKVSKTKYIYESDIITGINYIVDNDAADVMNMSFGSYGYSTGEYLAIEAGMKNNIISVAAAGNDNVSTLHYPSAFENTIAISAVDSIKQKASFSNYGEYIMFASPGVDILSINGTMSGTSMATPHAASAIAILKTLNKELNFDSTINILRRYSDDIGDISWDENFGYGFINFEEAEICDGTNCDEYNVFKKSSRDDLGDVLDNYEIKPILTDYNYGTINNILNTEIKINYTNGKSIDYKLYNIKNLEISKYDPYSYETQEIDIKFTTSLGITIEDTFEITNPSSYKSEPYKSVWEYNILSNNNIELTKFKDINSTVNTLYIPEKIDGHTVTAIADGTQSIFKDAWTAFSKVNYLYLPSTLTRVGDSAFSGSTPNGLSYVRSEAENLEVGDYAFNSSRSLVALDANLSYIGDYAFYYADQIRNIKLSEELTYIGTRAFYFGLNGAKLKIPKNVTTIGNGAFLNSGVKEIIFNNTMETIPDEMFKTSTSDQNYVFNQLEKVVLPQGLTTIGKNSFHNRSNLKSINIPDTVTYIGDEAFLNALDDASIIIPENVTYLGNNVFKNSGIKEIIFNNSMTEIPDNMFSGVSNLEKIILPAGVKKIGKNAFRNCAKLNEINLPDGLLEISSYAFYGALKDVSLTIPQSVKTIDINAFSNTGLKEIIFNNELEQLSNYLFSGSVELEKVVLPEGLKEIGNATFSGCSKLKEINLPESLTTIGGYAFENTFHVESNVSLEIPENVLSIGEYAFYKTNLKEITLNNNIENLSNYMFWLSKNLEKVVLPEGLKQIGNYAFAGCSKLKEVDLPGSLTTIGNNAFGGAFDIESKVSITIPQNVILFGKTVFSNSNVNEVIFENRFDILPESMFYKNINLEKVVLPEGLKEIEYFAFQNAEKLQKINLPDSLNIIEAGAFENCKSLKEIYFGKNVIEIGDDAFLNIASRAKFYLYNNSFVENYAVENTINYNQIDPDTITVKAYNEEYSAFDKIDLDEIYLELTYSEKTTRREYIRENIEVLYQSNADSFRYGDTLFKVIAYTDLDYKVEQEVMVDIKKATPEYTLPDNLTATYGQKLSEIILPDGFEWMNPDETIEKLGDVKFKVKFTPNDTVNYNIMENIDVNIKVKSDKVIIVPNIIVSDKIYDGTSELPIENILIDNLDKNDYSITSINLSSSQVGANVVRIVLRLTDDKFKTNSFEDRVQEKEFTVRVKIIPLKFEKPNLSDIEYIYDGSEQTAILDNFIEDKMDISGNKRTYAGEQDIVISLKDNNYAWSDGSSSDLILKFKIEKATPEYTLPDNLTATYGQKLSEIILPDGFEWMNPDEIIETSGQVIFKIKFIPNDTNNYKIIDNLETSISVSIKKYIITFNSNDEKNTSSTQEIEHNRQTKLRENSFTREGYKFVGWNTKKDGTGTIYSNNQEISITGNLNLYAQWKETYSYIINKYSVDEKNGIISGIPIKTSEEQFRGNVDLNVGYTLEIVKQKDKSNIGTNSLIKIYKDGILHKEFVGIVKGDITGDGLITLADMSKFYNYYQKNITMNKYFELAADVNGDSKFSLADLSKFYNYYQGKINKL